MNPTLEELLQEARVEAVAVALSEEGSVTKAAERLAISRWGLYMILKRSGRTPDEFLRR